MNLFRRLLGLERRSSVQTAHPRDPVLAEWFGGAATASGVQVSEESAIGIAAVYACVRILARTLATTPLHLYRRLPGGDRERADDHQLAVLLRDAPNLWQTGYEFREMLMGHLALRGNAYAEIVKDNAENVLELIPLSPATVTPRWTTNGQEIEYAVAGAKGRILPADRMLHLRGLSGDLLRGLSPITVHRETLGEHAAAQAYSARFFGNGAQPKGGLKVPGALTPEQTKQFMEAWDSRHRGADRSNRPALLHSGLEWVQIGMSHDDAQFVETRTLTRRDIFSIFGIPPHKAGDLERATFCLPAGTLVSTVDGPKPIETIESGDRVWSLSSKGEWIKSPVKRSACTGEDEILTIRTTNRTLRANAKHRILVRTKVADPTTGIGGYQRIKWENRYIAAGELKRGDTLVCLDRLPTDGASQTPTRQARIGFMEFCGLLLGDGNIGLGWGVQIARAADAQYMDHYRAVIRREFVQYDGGNGRGDLAVVALRPVNLQEGERQTKFSSVLAARELQRLGLAGTARTKSVPAWVFGLTEELRLAFLRGFLDADGSVDKLGRISFSSVNGDMLAQIRHLCIGCGIPVTNQRLGVGTTRLPNGKMQPFAQWSFTCSDPGNNRRIGSNDPRYVERLNSGRPFSRKGRNYPRYGGRNFDLHGCSLSRVVSIEVGETEPVYDLAVEDRNFIADGVLVHNSNIEHQSIEFVTDAIEPWTRAWEQRLKRALMPPEMRTRYFLEFDLKGLLRGDTAARSAFYRELFGIGALSANDVRRAENLTPIDGGDQYFVPLNMAPADHVMDILLKDKGGETDPPMRSLPPPPPPRTNGATNHGH